MGEQLISWLRLYSIETILFRRYCLTLEEPPMKRILALGLVCIFGMLTATAPAQDKKKMEELKKGLQALNDFVGEWNGDGKSAPTKPNKVSWAETFEWGWRFKGDDVWMTWKFKDSKLFKSGDLRYVPDKKNFQLTAVDIKDQKLVFDGKVEKEY